MNVNSGINSINFDTPGSVTVSTNRNVLINKIPEFTTVSHIIGQQFKFACVFNNAIAAVSSTDTPPYTPFFLLLYQKSTGVFLKAIEFPSKILGLRCNETMLFISLEDTVQAYDIKNFRSFATIDRKSSKGLFDCNDEYVAYPDDRNQGFVTIAQLPGFNVIKKVKCHTGSIHNISLTIGAKTFVTASSKGTLLRVFSIETGEQLHEFRRGFTKGDIVSISSTQEYVCACSEKTLHVFNKEGSHESCSLPNVPISCIISQNKVMVAMVDGIMAVFMISVGSFSLQLINQNRLLPPIPLGSKRNRSYTI